MTSDIETNIVAVERIKEYEEISEVLSTFNLNLEAEFYL
jgi:hypothetical protein